MLSKTIIRIKYDDTDCYFETTIDILPEKIILKDYKNSFDDLHHYNQHFYLFEYYDEVLGHLLFNFLLVYLLLLKRKLNLNAIENHGACKCVTSYSIIIIFKIG